MAESVVVPKNPMVGSLVGGCARAARGDATAPQSSVMNSRRFMGAPSSGLGSDITTPLRKNAVVHHSKNCALMSQLGPKCEELELSILCPLCPR